MANDVAIQADGRIVAAGLSYSPDGDHYPDFALARFTVAGTLDATFGSGGKVISPFGRSDDEASAVALQSNGKIVAAGSRWNERTTNDEFALARYTTSGTLDATFGSGGKVTTPIGPYGDGGAYDVGIQSDGKIVAAGRSFGSHDDFALIRYTRSGALDTTFGAAGKVITPIGLGSDAATAVAIQSDGKIVAAGISYTESYSEADFALARYTTSGALDTTFGSGGVVTTSIGTCCDIAHDVAIQADGKIVIAGESFISTSVIALARYTTSGALDTTFGIGGMVTTPVGQRASANAVAIQSDGKIVAAGTGDNGSNFAFALARYTTSGVLDSTFGTGGVVTTPFRWRDEANAVAIQSDGKIVAAGWSWNGKSNSAFALARYLG